jgi:UDP-2,4-diacetamido-2,4,6-trideoxy-beta-L-altropyranose hydrolase
MQVVFRTDAGLSTGSGHLMRCLALALALKTRNAEVSFICADSPGFNPSLISEMGFALHVIPVLPSKDDAEQSLRIVKQLRPDWLVVDHYGLGIEWERALRACVPRLMAIEDLANRPHHAEILLDQNLRADCGRGYEPLLPERCNRLLGPGYALLRPQFAATRVLCKPRSRIPPRLLLFMGGGDEHNVTLGVLKLLQESALQLAVETVVGQSHPAREDIENFCKEQGWGYHCQIADMASLMAECDLAIGAGGISSWERCALGLPALLITLAGNQAENAVMLERTGAAISLGWWNRLDSGKIREVLDALDAERLSAMSQAAFALVDGMGAQRVAEFMLDENMLKRQKDI